MGEGFTSVGDSCGDEPEQVEGRHFQDGGDSLLWEAASYRGAVERDPLTGQLSSAQSGKNSDHSFGIPVFRVPSEVSFCSVPRKMPGHVKLGASGEPDPGALV